MVIIHYYIITFVEYKVNLTLYIFKKFLKIMVAWYLKDSLCEQVKDKLCVVAIVVNSPTKQCISPKSLSDG